MAFLNRLAHNKPMFVPFFGATPQSIEAGDKWIGIFLPKHIVNRSPALVDWAPRDQPLFCIVPRDCLGWSIGSLETGH